MALSETFVRQVKHTGAPAGDKHTDGDGMYLLVKAVGKYWRLNYRYGGKQKTLALGVYPEVKLADARRRRDEAKAQLANGLDPSEQKKAAKRSASRAAGSTFEAVARDWLRSSASKRAASTQERVTRWIENDVIPKLGDKPIAEINSRDVLDALQVMENRGVTESTHRVKNYISGIFEYAMVLGMADRDPTVGLAAALITPKVAHFPSITDPAKVAGLLRAIWEYHGHIICGTALKVAPYVFVRPGELRHWEWDETDLDTGTWSIPGEKMKMANDHIVPLSHQVVAQLRALHRVTGGGKYVFPTLRHLGRPMSENTINAALRSLGYSGDQMVGHGFRAMARTILDEVLGERVDLIEHQLAHSVRDANGRAYNRTAHLPARREMMQRWADYLDGLRTGVKTG